MGRKKVWTDINRDGWEALRNKEGFKALESIASTGLLKAEPADIRPLVEESPLLNSHENLSSFRREIRKAIKRIESQARRDALLALLRSTPESELLSLDQCQSLARVYLGEAEANRRSVARKVGKSEDKVTALEMIAGLTNNNEGFRRAPKKSHRPGERLRLLRELYDQLVLDPSAVLDPEVTDQPLDPGRPEVEEDVERDYDQIRRVLSRRYGTELELTRFAAVLIDEHRALENLSLKVELKDYDEEMFSFKVSREFRARFDRYVVGIAAGDRPHRAIMRLVPELRELIWLPAGTDLDSTVSELVAEGLLMVRDPAAPSGYTPALFEDLQPRDSIAGRVETEGLDSSEYRLIEAQIDSSDEHRQYRSLLDMHLRRQRRRCTWFADGPTYVDEIQIDIGEFEDAATSSHVSVAYFLPGTDLPTPPQRYERSVQSWVVRHHGFTISW